MTSKPRLKLITTQDGSQSLYNEAIKESYHSLNGARGESDHVFIKNGLDFLVTSGAESLKLLEIGMGTGLNVYLTVLYAVKNHLNLEYTALEPYPIPQDIYAFLNYPETEEEKELFLAIHNQKWSLREELSTNVYLTKIKSKIQETDLPSGQFDLVYFDAFAPSKQPEMWDIDNLIRCYDWMSTGAVLVTYCAKGQFKRDLREVGFQVETLQGAMGKKEMVRAIK
jgi:tRNA U34 5-methylaminomethyl-2-thiouridine-forming methyltransferase MnmC